MSAESTAARVAELVSRIEKVTNNFESLHSRMQPDGATPQRTETPPKSVTIESFAGITERLGAVVRKVEHIENNLTSSIASVSPITSPQVATSTKISAVPSPVAAPKEAVENTASPTPTPTSKAVESSPAVKLTKTPSPSATLSPTSAQKMAVVRAYYPALFCLKLQIRFLPSSSCRVPLWFRFWRQRPELAAQLLHRFCFLGTFISIQ